ncbi:MAG: hypothetical protein L0H79_15675 [Intrasporangium sp.]|uniref:hypothetical protein n=1 Tax=Intrasporangium sp. TaxID=1925024 RepID=UPI0026490EA2|nr:hypothetical protein [Intrasporangium sp.]MDN5797175.1 hypothetical protein [Intrasporangium sp.]
MPFYRRFEVWFPAAVYLVSRIFVLIAGTYLSRYQIALPIGLERIRITYPVPADPGYLGVMTNWDGQWYRVIAENGYPGVLPRTDLGEVDMNPWAFYPVFPLAVGAIMWVTGLPFAIVGPVLSTLIGFAAVHLLFRLVDRAVGRWEAIVAVVAVCFYVASPIFSASYTESTALLLVVVCLMLLRARRYGWLVLALLVLALSRNVVIAMVPVIIAHAALRWRQGDEGSDPVRFRVGMAVLALYAGVLTWLWPSIASIVTQTPGAYTQTMLAWHIKTSLKLYQWWNLVYDYAGILGQVGGIIAVAAYAWWMLSRHSWRWGPELWGWAGAYPAYLLLVTNTTPSRVRYAMLAFTMALILASALRWRPWRRYRYWLLGAVAVAGAAQMWWYTANYLVIDTLSTTSLLYP